MAITVADLNVKLRADTRGVAGDLKAANTALGGVGNNAQTQAGRVSGAFGRIGPTVGTAMAGVGAIAGGGLLAATSAAVTLQDEMASVATVVPTADLAGLTDQVQELSRASGQSTTDLTAGLYDLVSAGVPAEEAISVLTASTNLAIGGLGTTAGAADVVTSAMNAYGLSAESAGGITDTFALAIQRGKVTADEIGASIANIAPIAASAGIGLDEVSAAYGGLTAKGVPAAQATTQMRAAISALLTPNEKLNALQEQTGVNFADLAAEKGLGVALETLRVATEGNATALDKLAGISAEDFPDALKEAQTELGLTNSEIDRFSAMAGKDGAGAALAELAKEVGAGDSAFAGALGSVEGYQFALNATGEAGEVFQDQLGDYSEALEGTGIAAEQAAIKQDTAAGAGARLMATLNTFAQDVGGPFVDSLGPAVFALNQFGPAMRGIPRLATAAGGALGAVAGKALPMLASGLMGLVPMLGGAVTGLVTGIGGLFAAAMPLLVAALPILLIGAVIAAIAVLIFNEEIRNKVFGFIGGILGWIGEGLGKIGAFLGEVVGAIVGFFGDLLAAAGQAIASFIGGWIQAGVDLVTTIGSAIGSVVSMVLAIPGRIASWIGSVVGQAGQLASGVLSAIATGVGSVVSTILGIPGRIVSWIGSIIGQAGQMIAGVVGAIGNGVATVVGFYLSIPGRIIGLIGSVIGIAVRAIGGFVSNFVNGIGRVVGFVLEIPGRIAGLIGGFAGVAADAVSGFVGMFLGLPGKIAGIIGDAIAGAAGAVGDFLSDPLGAIGGFLPSFQEGTLSAPGGLAVLHPGEMVVPPDLSESFRRFLGAGSGPSRGGGDGGSAPATNVYQNLTVEMQGILPVRSVRDVGRGLRVLGESGVFPRRSVFDTAAYAEAR